MKTVAGQLARQARPSVAAVGTCNAAKPTLRHLIRPNLPAGEVPAHPSFTAPYIETLDQAARPEQEAFCLSLYEDGESQPRQPLLLEAHEPLHQHHALRPLLWKDQGMFQVQLNEPPAPPGHKNSDYYANVGDAIRTLRDDIPSLFQKDLDYSIYREDVVFCDPNLSFKGIKNYQTIFWSLRFHGKLFFKRVYVEVLRIWQPEDNQIKMRWQVHGVPRVWWEAEGTVDGISTYKLDKNGMIYEHSVDNVQLRDPPITNPLLYGLNYILAPRLEPQQLPIPGSWYKDAAAFDVGGSMDRQ